MPVRIAPLANCSSRTSFWVKVMAWSAHPRARPRPTMTNSRCLPSSRTRGCSPSGRVTVDDAGLVELSQRIQDTRATEAHRRRVADGLEFEPAVDQAQVLDGATAQPACRA